MDILATLAQEFAGILARLRGEEKRSMAMQQIYQQVMALMEAAMPDAYPMLVDLYVDNNETIAITSAAGKLYRWPVYLEGTSVTLGAPSEVEAWFMPARGRLSIIRQTDGAVRWFAQAASAVLNRVSEIDSRALFDSFVADAQKTGQYPVLRFYHTPGLDFGQADWLGRDGYLYLASGTLDMAHPLAQAFVDAVDKGRGAWGTSIGFMADVAQLVEIAEGVRVPVYSRGVNREISVLPETDAASWFTGIGLEVQRMNEATKKALVTLFGDEEKAQAFIAGVDETNRSIEDKGLITRTDAPAADAAPVVEVEQHATSDAEKDARAKADALAKAEEELTAKIVKAAGVAELAERLTKIEEALAKLTATEAERSAERTNQDARLAAVEIVVTRWQQERDADMPARPSLSATYRPREQKAAPPGAFASDAVAAATLSAWKK